MLSAFDEEGSQIVVRRYRFGKLRERHRNARATRAEMGLAGFETAPQIIN
jgi:hypothetical protein